MRGFGEFETCPDWVPTVDKRRRCARVDLKTMEMCPDWGSNSRASTAELRRGFEPLGSSSYARYTAIGGHRMATESLADVVRSLTPQEQDAVRQFIDYLKRRDASVCSQSFFQAADEFIAEHPELLQRLAQ